MEDSSSSPSFGIRKIVLKSHRYSSVNGLGGFTSTRSAVQYPHSGVVGSSLLNAPHRVTCSTRNCPLFARSPEAALST